MASVNRFTNIRPGNYNPMNLQELMLAPKYKRNQHDKLLEASAELDTAIAKVDPLAVHNEVAKKEQERLYGQVQSQVDLLNSEGFNPSSKGSFINLNKDYQKSISPTGIIGRINAAKEIFNKNKKSYLDNAIKAGYSPEAALMNWQDSENKYIKSFQETGEVNPIGEMFAPNYYDYIKEGKDLFKDAGISFSEIQSGGGRIVQDSQGTYVINSKSGKVNSNTVKQLEAAVDFLNNQIANPNSDAYKSILHQRKTPQQAIQELSGLSDVYIKSKTGRTSQSSIGSFKAAEASGLAAGIASPNYEYDPAENITGYSDKFIEKMKNNINGKSNSYTTPTGYTSMGAHAGAPLTVNKNLFSSKENEVYQKAYDIVKSNNPNISSDPYSKEAFKQVLPFLENNSDIMRQNIIITDDIVTQYGDRSIGINKNSPDKIAEVIHRNPKNRKYSIDGEIYNYDDLPDNIKENFNKVQYSGYYSPKNFLGFGKKENKDMFISPIKMMYRDDDGDVVDILVSRSPSERNTRSHKADATFQDIYQTTNIGSGEYHNFPKLNSSIKFDSSTKRYTIKTVDGKVSQPLTEQQLQAGMYKTYGVVANKEK